MLSDATCYCGETAINSFKFFIVLLVFPLALSALRDISFLPKNFNVGIELVVFVKKGGLLVSLID